LDPLPGSRVASGPEAVTMTPAPTNVGGVTYVDCPGFYDAAGPEQKIINAFSIHYLFSTAIPKSVVLVMPETDLVLDTAPILPLLRKMTETFPGDQLMRCLSMVITKQGAVVDPAAILRDLSARDPTRVIDLTPSVKGLLIHLADNCERLISFMPRPEGLGAYPDAARAGILTKIRNAEFLTRTICVPQLEPDSRILASELAI